MEVSGQMITSSGEIELCVMRKLHQDTLDGRGMPDDWALSIVLPVYKRKRDGMICGAYRGAETTGTWNEDREKHSEKED